MQRILSVAAVAISAVAVGLVAIPSPATRVSAAGLDRIDAAGVTEQGGSATYARMLTRTGTNGLLSASLLPPVADWASQPVSNLYYAAGNAGVQGNGSPQYPFNSLTHALSHMAPQSALVLAPATYSGTASLAAGRTVSLVGAGPGSYVSSLSLSVSGSSSDTCLALVGLRVGTLSVSGGRVNVRLSCATVGRLEGSSPYVTVTRTDLGSHVGVSTIVAGDMYTGYGTVPNANTLRDADSGDAMTLAGGRAEVTSGGQTHTVAYLSDIAASTNGISAALQGLLEADAALSSRVGAEEAARAASDAALSNRLDAAVASLGDRIGTVGTSWGGQLVTVTTTLGSLRSEMQDLRVQTAGAITGVSNEVESVRTAYTTADGNMQAELTSVRNTVSSLSSGLQARVEQYATGAASNQIAVARSGIVTEAVAAADVHIGTAQSALTQAITTNYDALTNRIESDEATISQLKSTLNSLIAAIASAGSLTNDYHVVLPAPVQ